MGDPSLDSVSVIIPVLNEEKAIGPVLDELLGLGVPQGNIVVVDGGSTDRTVEVARSRGVRVVRQEGRGKALAVKTGLRHVSTPYVVVMDGDWTYPAKFIPRLLEKALTGGCDLVIGARVFKPGSQGPLFKLGNRVLTWFFNALFGTSLNDVLSGMYLAKTDALREVNFEMSGFSVESEVVAHFATLGEVCEDVVEYRERLDPRAKKLRALHGLKIAWDMVRLTWRYMPVFFILILGALLTLPGLALGAWVAYRYFFHGVLHYVKGLVAIFLTGLGSLSLVAAVIALYIRRVELRIHRKLNSIAEAVGRREVQKSG